MSFEPGTKTIFCENTAPTGWSTVVVATNCTLRTTTSTGGGTGTGRPFSSLYSTSSFTATATGSNTNATVAPEVLPYNLGRGIAHYHPGSGSGPAFDTGYVDGIPVPPVGSDYTTIITISPGPPFIYRFAQQPPSSVLPTTSGSAGSDGAHSHTGVTSPALPIRFNGASAANLNIKYITAIVAQLD